MSAEIMTVGSNAVVVDSNEDVLTLEVSLIERRASSMSVSDDAGYADAGELVKQVKHMQKQAKNYWEPLRVRTKEAYDNVLARKKEMLSPLESAEKILKNKMANYTMEKERERRKREEEMRKAAREEAEKKLQEAAEAETKGDEASAEIAMTEAEIMDDVSKNGKVHLSVPKAKGVSSTKAWKITNIDPTKVPVEIAGMLIRPVDEKAVMSLIKSSKGTVQIPGIEYEETVSISVRT